jgi:hypothetical protein
MGSSATAAELLSCYEAMSDEMGGGYQWVTRMNEETLSIIRTELPPAAIEAAWAEGRKLTSDKALAVALDALGDLD